MILLGFNRKLQVEIRDSSHTAILIDKPTQLERTYNIHLAKIRVWKNDIQLPISKLLCFTTLTETFKPEKR